MGCLKLETRYLLRCLPGDHRILRVCCRHYCLLGAYPTFLCEALINLGLLLCIPPQTPCPAGTDVPHSPALHFLQSTQPVQHAVYTFYPGSSRQPP
jgi:hypothetical protein